jgi:hypothetical protein
MMASSLNLSAPDFDSVGVSLNGAKALAYLCAMSMNKGVVHGVHSLLGIAVQKHSEICDTGSELSMHDASSVLAQTLAVLDSACDDIGEDALFGLMVLIQKVKSDLDACIHAIEFPETQGVQ